MVERAFGLGSGEPEPALFRLQLTERIEHKYRRVRLAPGLGGEGAHCLGPVSGEERQVPSVSSGGVSQGTAFRCAQGFARTEAAGR